MYTITWIESRGQAAPALFSISTPSMSTASRLFWTMRCQCRTDGAPGGICARLWLAKGGKTHKLF